MGGGWEVLLALTSIWLAGLLATTELWNYFSKSIKMKKSLFCQRWDREN